MIFFRPGSQLHRLTAVLAVTGEIPLSGLSAFGSQRTVRALVARLVEPQTLHNTVTGEELTCRLLKLHGKGAGKTIRFYKSGLPVLDWLGVREYYLASFWNHNFPSNPQHSNRMERVTKTVLTLMQAGVEYRVWRLPALSILKRQDLWFSRPAYYLARDLKKVGISETNKVQFSRITGALFTADHVIPVYNTQNAVMKWSGEGEFKAKLSLLDLARKNTRIREIDSAILFGRSVEIATRTIESIQKNRRLDLRFDSVYEKIYFVPLGGAGVDQLRLLLSPDWNERMLSSLFDPSERSFNRGHFEYDAIIDGVYRYAFFDCDIARLIRFHGAITDEQVSAMVYCFPFQVSLVRRVFGDLVEIRTIEPKDLWEAIGIDL